MFQLQAGMYFPTSPEALSMVEKLPPGNYQIQESMRGYYLERIPSYTHIDKYYGDTKKLGDRILNTYRKRGINTGALFHGMKGTGKSLLTKYIAIEANAPVIIISKPLPVVALVEILGSVDGDCVVVFDEFEKNFPDRNNESESAQSAQSALLPLLDGGYNIGAKLFLLTSNNVYAVSDYMLNRPGRVYYSIEFKGLSEEFVREYCSDNLKNMDHLDSIIRLAHVFRYMSFDILQSIVEELNRYNESLKDILPLLNIDLNSLDSNYFGFEYTGKEKSFAGRAYVNVTANTFDLYGYDEEGHSTHARISNDDMVKFEKGHYFFEGKGYKLELHPADVKSFRYF